jgi:hypothetical protein
MLDQESDAEFVNDIAPDVLGVLEKDHFFERLDDLFCPVDRSGRSVSCGHSFDHSVTILQALGMDPDDVDDVLAALKSKGGCFDCEVLYNVAEESRLKARYWKARAAELAADKKP